MKYYSEVLKKLYETQEDLVKAETNYKTAQVEKIAKEKAAKERRAARAKEVETALKELDLAKVKANKLLTQFVEDYGYFHTSYALDKVKDPKDMDTTVDDFVKRVFSFLGGN